MTLPQISRTVLADHPLAEPVPTAHVEIRRITLAPDVAVGRHVHNGPVLGSIESGSVTFRIDGGDSIVLRPGDTFYEPADVPIDRFDAGPEGAVFLGYFLLAAGQEAALVPL